MTAKTTEADREEMLRMCAEREAGDWKHTYMEIAKRFGVTRCRVSILARRAGLPKREGLGRKRSPLAAAVPPEFRAMYRELMARGKMSKREAAAIVAEHAARRAADVAGG